MSSTLSSDAIPASTFFSRRDRISFSATMGTPCDEGVPYHHHATDSFLKQEMAGFIFDMIQRYCKT